MPPIQQPLVRNLPSLSLTLAQEALTAALTEAEKNSIAVSFALVDAAGQTVLAAHMDGAPAPSRAIALRKATTAVGFNTATADWDEILQGFSAGVREGLPLMPGLALFGGGEPLRHAGAVIGAIGVSGSSEALDIACAQAGVRRVQELLGAG